MTEPIKLPPLPGGVAVVHVYDADEMQSYARLAVEQATADLRKEFDSYENFSCQLVAALRKERDEARAELASVLSDWNDLVKAIGSPTNVGAVGHGRALRERVAELEAARHRAEKAEAERNEALKKTERREQNWSLIHSALEAAGIHLRSRDDDWLQEIIIQCAKERNEARAELSACADERNNYSRILTVLGMEEEGDPVAEVDALMQERDQLHEARAEWARLTTLRPASEHDGATLVLAMHRQGTRQRLTRHLEPWEEWLPLPDVKETK
ncbi:MAG: hypothetical protein ACK5QX_04815 [bacterium]